MRFELETNEKTKQEMIQNISHDFKTPIAVIQSYAEAIRDEITSIEDTQIIIKQADILNRKVKQLIELTKIENDVTEVSRTPVVIKEVIKHILDQQKYRSGIVFETSLDDSTWFGVYDYFHSAFSNIVDNMLRYANTKISIHLEKNVLTFYNDGEAIEENLIEKLFKPYEKGPKGQFGLGLSIVKRTMDLFDLTITIKNEDHGVKFIISPR
jgi:two-component system sensor histidine kinase CssS